MKRLPLAIIAFAVAILIVSCHSNPVSTARTNNKQISVSILFDFDGVRVYRFKDGGESIYFAKRVDGVDVSWVKHVMVGKVIYSTPIQVSTEN